MTIYSIVGIGVGDYEEPAGTAGKAEDIVDFYYKIKALMMNQSALVETDTSECDAVFVSDIGEKCAKTAPIPIPTQRDVGEKIEKKRI